MITSDLLHVLDSLRDRTYLSPISVDEVLRFAVPRVGEIVKVSARSAGWSRGDISLRLVARANGVLAVALSCKRCGLSDLWDASSGLTGLARLCTIATSGPCLLGRAAGTTHVCPPPTLYTAGAPLPSLTEVATMMARIRAARLPARAARLSGLRDSLKPWPPSHTGHAPSALSEEIKAELDKLTASLRELSVVILGGGLSHE